MPDPLNAPTLDDLTAGGAPLRLVVMGVSGCGKSTLAATLAARWNLAMIEGDELHSQANVAKMRAGIALQDEDRWEWLARVGAELARPPGAHRGRVVACSALKRAYRDVIRAACPGVVLLFLDGARAPLLERMQQRQDHYMPPALLDSQLATLERPGPDEPDVVHLQLEDTPEDQVATSLRGLARCSAAWRH